MRRKKLISAAMIVFLATVLLFVFSGHNYLAYTFYFIAALIVIFDFAGRKLKRIICILLAVGFAYFAVLEGFIISEAGGNSEDADYIIVLGAAVHGETPSMSLVERMTAAKEYLEDHPDCIAVLSGGRGSNEKMSEADAMYDWLTQNGIPENRLIKEDKASSTYENLKFSYELIGDTDKTVAVVSSEYHLYRAKLIAADMGYDVGTVAAHTTYPTVMINYFIREAFGLTYYYVSGI